MSIKQENLIPLSGDFLPGQRLTKIGGTFVPVGFGADKVPGTTVVKDIGKGLYYKCTSVGNTTWSGNKAFQNDDGTWGFEDAVTSGLTFTEITPEKGKVYSFDALVEVKLWTGIDITENATVSSITYDSYSCPIDPTGYEQGNYTISASSELGGQRSAYNAFYDHNNLNEELSSWHSASGTSGQWLQWQSTEKVLINGYSLSFADRDSCLISSWRLEGSDDGSTWTALDSVSGYNPSRGTVLNRIVANDISYFYHRIYVESVNYGDYVTIGLIRAGEVIEYAN